MTTAEILAMQPGPELDALLAPLLGYSVKRWPRSVDGCNVDCCCTWHNASGMQVARPFPSRTWEGMRLVVEAMAAKGWWLILSVRGVECEATFVKDSCSDRNAIDGLGQTAPHAVAIAARLALESDHAR